MIKALYNKLCVKSAPTTKNSQVWQNGKKVYYNAGQVLKYDKVVENDGYIWASYIGASSGQRRYVPLQKIGGTRWWEQL